MKKIGIGLFLLLFVADANAKEPAAFSAHFRDAVFRLDYYHSGTKIEEHFGINTMFEEGAWPGSLTNLVDTMNLGEFLFKITDAATNQVIYSHGYSTMFNEWQTTEEATAGVFKTILETARFPFPLHRFQFSISKRNKQMMYQEMYSTIIDPQSIDIHREKHIAAAAVNEVIANGDPHEKVDLVILGDGYAKKDMDKFRADVKHFTAALFSTSPFKERKNAFNVWAVEVESPESGIDQPDVHIYTKNALGATYNTFGSARYVLTEENKTLCDYAALAPYDVIYILVNAKRYGGGGIFRLYATCFTIGETPETAWQTDYVFVHEFGHSFAGLGDEYYSSSVAYNDFYPKGIEPWEPNIAATVDRALLKWGNMVDANTALPTPWAKEQYDSVEAARGKLRRDEAGYAEQRERLLKEGQAILHARDGAPVVGAYEGAGYSSKGLYRPAIDCRMFSLSLIDFDPVCSRAINAVIDFYTH